MVAIGFMVQKRYNSLHNKDLLPEGSKILVFFLNINQDFLHHKTCISIGTNTSKSNKSNA